MLKWLAGVLQQLAILLDPELKRLNADDIPVESLADIYQWILDQQILTDWEDSYNTSVRRDLKGHVVAEVRSEGKRFKAYVSGVSFPEGMHFAFFDDEETALAESDKVLSTRYRIE